MPEAKVAEVKSAPAKVIAGYAIERDGFMPGSAFLLGYRVVTVMAGVDGKGKIEKSAQKYILEEARAIVDDKLRDALGL